jgi:hypothetical protein
MGSILPQIPCHFIFGMTRYTPCHTSAITMNGQVEGQVNRLKFQKRMGYGRANFDLLQLRVLLRA